MIYLDNAATSKPDEESVRRAEKYLYEDFYNPSALYEGGLRVSQQLKAARRSILSLIANENDFSLIFTSGGTEADNQAVFFGGRRGNVVTTLGEHSAVYSSVNELKQKAEVRLARLNADGSVDVQHLLSLIDDKTSLASVVHVNNETGAVNDIADIAKRIKSKNRYTLFHSDGVQAFGKIRFRFTGDIDMYSVSAHKIGGIKGCGALISRKNLAVKPFVFGGGQEKGLRSGTENVFGIKCFEYAAIKRYADFEKKYKHVCELNERLRSLLDADLFNIISSQSCSPYILCFAASGVRGETILHEADDAGIIIGTGSACSSNEKKRYSRVILSCGVKEADADGVLRVSFSPENTLNEVEEAAEKLNNIVKNRLDKMS